MLVSPMTPLRRVASTGNTPLEMAKMPSIAIRPSASTYTGSAAALRLIVLRSLAARMPVSACG